MKGFSNPRKCFLCMIFLITFTLLPAHTQQNTTLFFMHSIPESNFVNPAVQIDCGIFIGLPLVSSTHINIANSGFSAGKFVTLYTDGTIRRNSDMSIAHMTARNYFVSELHTVLLAVGIKRNDLYYNFTITEKNNGIVIYTPDLLAFSLRGSDEFEGQLLNTKGTRVLFNHIREYAFGVSKKYPSGLTLGAKVKVLFGKFNYTTGNSTFGLSVESGSQDIIFDFDATSNSSMPWALREEGPGVYRYSRVYDASLFKHLMNMRNPGLAMDFGFIYPYNSQWTFSGSLLDVGLLWYRSNLNNFALNGQHTYQGPLGNGQVDDTYLWATFDELNANMNESLTADPYFYFLDPKLYLGASYHLNNRYDLNMLMYNRFLPGKVQTGAMVSLLTRADKAFRGSVSWSYMNNSVVNLGAGLSYGKRPLQLYVVTDNIFGFILPLSAKNVNLRFGINLNIRCREIFDIDLGGCSWMQKEQVRRLRKEKIKK